MDQKIFVTQPLLPDLDRFKEYLDEIWESKYITNNGPFHRRLQSALRDYLGVEYISLFANGTLPLLVALKLLDLHGQVITTPYSFVATSNVLFWRNLTPVFVDVDEYGNINPDLVQAAVTPRTSAILAVHVYGNPCDTKRIRRIADKYGLKVIYDAAHAFGVEKDGESILNAGDLSTVSFHATKVFNTVQGGALVCHSAEMKKKVDDFKNFGIENETTVAEFGINCKMDEIRAAYGLLNLEKVDNAIAIRKRITEYYRAQIENIEGLTCFYDTENVKHNYSYFPIFINEKYPMTRDMLYEHLKISGIYSRRYFYPLISEFSIYRQYGKNLPNAMRLADSVLCLPLYGDMTMEDAEKVITALKN